ncbi:hypothetical protein RA210_U250046 [Rubrivivax sp. A210]|uniref:hypothetical protein n=1 Tax=Rubrivivax sp. A210 TaxID=2772301 RepID=UPI0019193295|nr:hypothetical protein [Rubrivivax sp. A210]CAD5372947.1 hypothetical protein RA210_U250046 [Rubrivivax sp. A210]
MDTKAHLIYDHHTVEAAQTSYATATSVTQAAAAVSTPAVCSGHQVFHVLSRCVYEMTCLSSGEMDLNTLETKLPKESAAATAGIGYLCTGLGLSPQDFAIGFAIVPTHTTSHSGPRRVNLGVSVSFISSPADLNRVLAYYKDAVHPHWNAIFDSVQNITKHASSQASLDLDSRAPAVPSMPSDAELPLPDRCLEPGRTTDEAAEADETTRAQLTAAAQQIAAKVQGKTLNLLIASNECTPIERTELVQKSQRKPQHPEEERIYGRLNLICKTPAVIQILGVSSRDEKRKKKLHKVSYKFTTEMILKLAKCLVAHGDSEFVIDQTTYSDATGAYLYRELKDFELPRLLPTETRTEDSIAADLESTE